MDVTFGSKSLERLEKDPSFNAGFSDAVVNAYRRRMQQIRAARDERTFFPLRALHFEKLKGDRAGQYSMRLNEQWRLIIEIEGKAPAKILRIVEIVDYH